MSVESPQDYFVSSANVANYSLDCPCASHNVPDSLIAYSLYYGDTYWPVSRLFGLILGAIKASREVKAKSRCSCEGKENNIRDTFSSCEYKAL